MTLVLFFLPVFVLLYTLFLGRKLGSSGIIFISCLTSFIQMISSFWLYIESFVLNSTIIYEFRVLTIFDGYDFRFGLLVDRLSSGMLLIITVISFAVQLYSTAYLREDPHRARFCLYLQLFTFFMLMLVLSPNYFQLFLGWEGVGLTSYLLVNFWYTRVQANKSGLKALFVNRVGDVFYMFALFFCLIYFRTTDFNFILTSDSDFAAQLISVLFILAAAAKSAQFGLHTWLPDAMEGPTPVSALIHAATMVTAGVFLMLRLAPVLSMYEFPSTLLIYLGSFTAFFAATTGSCQYDFKKIIAYSTCSQLGYMMAAIGVGAYDTCFYHLVNHAFFKALLFLTAGIIIHSLSNEQDLRLYGGLIRFLPYSYVMILIGSLGLTGFPFISGYYSKDNLLECVLSSDAILCYVMLVLTASVTAYYSVRTMYLVFAERPRFRLGDAHLVDAEPLFVIPTTMLFFFTLFHGYIARDLYLGLGSTLYPELSVSPLLPAEFSLSTLDKLIPLLFSFLGSIIGVASFKVIYNRNFKIVHVFKFFNKRWWFDLLDTYSLREAFRKSYVFFSVIEKGHNESLSSETTKGLKNKALQFLRNPQNGLLHLFITIFIITLVIFLVYLSWTPGPLPLLYAYRISEKSN